MRLFGALYDRCITLARHRHAPGYLAAISAAESVAFPVPPDVMLAPMALAQPRRWWWFALVCTVASVLGGLLGYALGHLAIELVMPWVERLGYGPAFEQGRALFERYGFWIIVIAGFTPIPYKVFTILSGSVGMPLLPFVLGSLVGRGGRFFLVAALMGLGGPKFEPHLKRNIEWLGWLTLVAIAVGLVWWEVRG